MGDMKLRIAYLVSRYPAISHTFILREVLALRRRGFEIHTASINPPNCAPEGLTDEELHEVETTFYIKSVAVPRILAALLGQMFLSPLRFFAGFLYALRIAGSDLRAMLFSVFYFGEAVLLSAWMRRKGLSHVHVHFATPAATVALIATRIAKIEFSVTVHGPDEFYEAGRYQLAEKLRRAQFVCAIGQYCRSQLMKLSAQEHWHKFEISPLGVDPEVFSPVQHKRVAGQFRILCVGRLVSAKGQAILLEAVSQLLRNRQNVFLTLVGDGPDRAGLERFASGLGIAAHVRFAGSVNQDSIRLLYGQSDAFVLPSFAEGIPVVLMEAMAMGIPCISTTITGIPELIVSGREGILVPPSDVALLAGAIMLLNDAPALAARIAARGRDKVHRAYNLDTNIDKLAAIFQRRLNTLNPAPLHTKVIA